MPAKFRIAYTADFFENGGKPRFRDYGASLLNEHTGLETSQFEEHQGEIAPDQIGDAQAVIVLTPRVTAQSLSQNENLLAICRFGVGYDSVDVAACTASDVLLTITCGAVDRPVAEATVGWMIALSHHVLVKDRLVREGRWNDRTGYMGTELRDKTLGVIGLGGIGRALVKLLSGFGMNTPLAFDPYLDDKTAAARGVRKVPFDRLLKESDFVSLNCPLNEETRHMIGARELSLMKSSAFLINTARGSIVDEEALFEALSARRIAGAALDCFEEEPLLVPHRFRQFDNVLLAPHSIAWTHELFRDIGRMASRSALDLAFGRRPNGVINPEVFDRRSFLEKWERLKLQSPETPSETILGAQP